MLQGIPVALLSSSEADVRANRLGFSNFADLLNPLSRVDLNIKDPITLSSTQSNVELDFRDLSKQGYLLSLTVLPSILHEALLSGRNLTDCLPLFKTALSRWIEPIEQETFRSYVACVFVVAGCEENFMSVLSQIIQQQHSQQHGSSTDSNILAPSHCAPPKWRTPNTLKHYILVHDCNVDDENRSNDSFRQMCSTYGSENCHLLKIGSGDGIGLPDIWQDNAESERILELGLERARKALMAKATTDECQKSASGSSISTISPSYSMTAAPPSDNSCANSSQLPSPTVYKRNVSSADREALRQLLLSFSKKSLIPHCERLMRTLFEQINQRRGITRSFASGVKKFGGFFGGTVAGTTQQTAPVSYSSESAEMQTRRLADHLFELGLYSLAHQQYQTVKKEFAADNAVLHQAGALEMSALSLFLTNSTSMKSVEYLEHALQIYLDNSARWISLVRCALTICEVHSKYKMYRQIAVQLGKLTIMDNDLCVGVCLTAAANSFDDAQMVRKAAFYRVLAGHRFLKCEQPILAMECYRVALNQYFEKNWDHAEDHIAYLLSCESSDRNVSLACATRLLRQSGHLTVEQQMTFLKHYVNTLKRFCFDDTIPSEVAVPVVDQNLTRVICGERPLSDQMTSVGDHPWIDIQRAAYHELTGSSSSFRPLHLISDGETDNQRARESPPDERVRVQLHVANPMDVEITIYNVRLGISDIKWRGDEKDRDAFHAISSIETITLEPRKTTIIELWVTPTVALSQFRISRLLFELDGTNGQKLKAQVTLLVKGKRLNKTPAQLKSETYAVDERLCISVAQSKWPLLDIVPDKLFGGDVYCGQAQRMILELKNIGGEPISGICIASDCNDTVSGGVIMDGTRHLKPSRVSSNNNTVQVIPLDLRLELKQSAQIFIDVRSPNSPGLQSSVAVIVYYRGEDGAYREWRTRICSRTQSLITANAKIIGDRAHGLVSLEIKNELPSNNVAMATVDIRRIRARTGRCDNRGQMIEGPRVALHPVRMRGVQLECTQSDSVCFSISERSPSSTAENTLWLSSEISEIPFWPILREENNNPNKYRLYIDILWKASIVNNQGQVYNIIGETLVADPFDAINANIPGIECLESSPNDNDDQSSSIESVAISCSQVAPISHDFGKNRLCEFPLTLCVRNQDRRRRTCNVVIKFIPKVSIPMQPPLLSDARHQWWVDRETVTAKVGPLEEKVILVKVRISEPSSYDLDQIQAVAFFDGNESDSIQLKVPKAVAVILSQ